MKSRDERRADFERREAIRKEKFRLSETLRKEKSADKKAKIDARYEASSANLNQRLEEHSAQRDLQDAARVSTPSMLGEMGFENPTAMPFAVVDAVQRSRARKRLKKRGLL